jgi:hypothetical protein
MPTRRSSYLARILVLGIVSDDIFGALINASSSRNDSDRRGGMVANRRDAAPTETSAGFDESPVLDRLAA